MRKIKFLVWDTKLLKFLEEIPYSENCLDNGWNNSMLDDLDGLLWKEAETFNDRLVWCQFTGLLDSNKNEIYENFTLQIELPMGGFWGVNTTKIGKVIYNEDKGGFVVEWKSENSHQNYTELTCDIAINSIILNKNLNHIII